MQQQRDALNAAAAIGQSSVQSQAETLGRSLFASQVADTTSTSDQQFVTNLYEAFLQRGPDASGLNFWTSIAAGGSANRQNVLNAFAVSTAFRALSATLYRETFWLVTDHLGTPRMVVDKSGSLSGIKRHDYLPFGEELYANTGGRTTTQGYSAVDDVRQKFTSKERDNETGLDFFGARYYGNIQGRFTTVDPQHGEVLRPQTWNAYTYAVDNPLGRIDPDGAKDIPAHVAKFVMMNQFLVLKTAIQYNVSASGLFAIGAWESQWGTSNAYRNEINPFGLSGGSTSPNFVFGSYDEAYQAWGENLNKHFKRAVGKHDGAQFLETIEDDHGEKYNADSKAYLKNVRDRIMKGFGLSFYDSVLNSLRDGTEVTFNGVTVSNVDELSRLLEASVPSDQIRRANFLEGVYDAWRDYVSKIGKETDPNVQQIRREYTAPGSSVSSESEEVYEYRIKQAFIGL